MMDSYLASLFIAENANLKEYQNFFPLGEIMMNPTPNHFVWKKYLNIFFNHLL